MAGKIPHTEFKVHLSGRSQEVLTAKQLDRFADLYSINRLVPGRYSHLLLLELYVAEKYQGLSPEMVTQEIAALETGSYSYTKPPTKFLRKPLKGLWHKHFFPADPASMVRNILNHLGKNGVERSVNKALDPRKGTKVTPEMINDLAYRIVEEPFSCRAERKRLTGEWLIYARHKGENYYLCIASHENGDEKIVSNLKAICCLEFDWLAELLKA